MPTREVENIFADIVERAKVMDPTNARVWFDELSVLHFDGGSIGIGCPDEAKVLYLDDNCRSSFTRAAQQITGHLVTVDFRVGGRGEPGRNRRRSGRGPLSIRTIRLTTSWSDRATGLRTPVAWR